MEDFADALSTGAIVAIVIGAIIALAVCIGFIVILVCIVNHCNRPKHPHPQGMALQQPYSYSNTWSSQYPPNMTTVSNYPPSYESAPPPYTAPAPSEPTKSPYT